MTLAVLAHLAGGGRAPDASTLAVLLACVGLLAAGVTARRRSLPHLLAGVVLVQVIVHVALIDHHDAGSAQPRLGVVPMTFAHALASLVLAWWLAKGEEALWRQAVHLLSRLSRLLAHGTVAFQERRNLTCAVHVTPVHAHTPLVRCPRGPPAAA